MTLKPCRPSAKLQHSCPQRLHWLTLGQLEDAVLMGQGQPLKHCTEVAL